MREMKLPVLYATLLCICWNTSGGKGGNDGLEISAPAGVFKGTLLQAPPKGQSYRAFRAIPYALPPIGKLRFAKPKSRGKVKGVFDASKVAPICVQAKEAVVAGAEEGQGLGQEDCLYLNVYLPAKEQSEDMMKVLVFIHGGGFFIGSGNSYVPGELVTKGNIIVVTLNYRLSWLGFLKGNSVQLPGNLGTWDQLMALKWVKDNIKSFGGDPDDITLSGQGSGSESVSALSIVPQSKNLFTRAMLMSSSMFSVKSSQGSSDVLLDLLTDRVGCKDKSGTTNDVEQVVACLRKLPADKFSMPQEALLKDKFFAVDDELFSESIPHLVKDTGHLTDVGFFSRSYLVTLVNNEGPSLFHGPFAIKGGPKSFTAKNLSQLLKIPAAACEDIFTWYGRPHNAQFKPVYDIIGDIYINIPTFDFLEAFAQKKGHPSKHGKQYLLMCDYTPGFMPRKNQGFLHGLEMAYVFDVQPKNLLKSSYHMTTDKGFSKDDLQVRKHIMNFILDFVKLGDPGSSLISQSRVNWPAFDFEYEQFLNLEPKPVVQQWPLRGRRIMWEDKVPQLVDKHRPKSGKGGKAEL